MRPWFGILLSSCLMVGMTWPSTVRGEQISSMDSFVNIDDIPSNAGKDSANVHFFARGDPAASNDSNVAHETMSESWWWFRSSLTSGTFEDDESAFHDPTSESYVGNTASFTFVETGFDATLSFVLNDDTLVQILRVTNTTNSLLELDIFHHTDIDLGDDANNDEAVLVGPGRLWVTSADGPSALEVQAAGATAYMAVDNDSPGDLEDLMRDGLPTDFDNSGLPFSIGDGDLNHGFQWTQQFSAAQTVSFEASYAVVPLPTSAWMGIVLLGTIGTMSVVRRRRGAA